MIGLVIGDVIEADDPPPAPATARGIEVWPDVSRACYLPAQPGTLAKYGQAREQAAKVRFYDGAALVQIERARVVRRGRGGREGGGMKQAVKSFTPRQRTAFLRALATVDQQAPALFVTLTWPTWAAPEGRGWEGPWDRFRMRLARRYPRAAGFYKRELTEAGVVHLHLLVYGVSWSAMRAFVPAAWAQSVHAPDEALRKRVGTQVAAARNGQGIRRYATKYVTKAMFNDEDADPSGPWWGRFNEDGIPTVVPVALAVPDDVAVRMIRTARKQQNAQRRARGCRGLIWHRFRTMTVIGDPEVWRALAVLYSGA